MVDMINIGVIYFSISGNSEKIARLIASKYPQVELIPIVINEKIPKYKIGQILKYGTRTIMNRPIDYTCELERVKEMDVIIIGFPIWVGRIPSPLREIISQVDLKDKKIAAYCTYDSSPGDMKDQLFAFTESELFTSFHSFKDPVDVNSESFNNEIERLMRTVIS